MGIIILLIAGYFIWKFNTALEDDDDGFGLLWICLGFGAMFVLAAILL